VVVLDRLRPDDMEGHLAGEDEEQARRLGWWPKRSGPAEFRRMLEQDADSWRRGGPRFRFAVRVSGELVGGCEIVVSAVRPASVSYWTFPAHRGHGCATRAQRVLCEWAFDALELTSVEAHVEEDNAASLGVASGAGFEATGRRDDKGLLILERERRADEGQSLNTERSA
jgi:RimJ/RimL family protein N-acetyltransferase